MENIVPYFRPSLGSEQDPSCPVCPYRIIAKKHFRLPGNIFNRIQDRNMLRPFPERQIKIFHIDLFRLLNGIKGFRNEPSGIHDSNPVSRLIQGKSFGARMHIMHKDPSFIRLLYPRKYSVDVHGIVQHAFKGTVADLYLSRTADEMRRVAVCGKHRAARTHLHPAYGYRIT